MTYVPAVAPQRPDNATTIWHRQPDSASPRCSGTKAIAAAGSRFVRSGMVIRLIGLFMLVCTIVVAALAVQYMREQTEAVYRREIGNLGTVLSEQTFRYIQEIDLVLLELRERAISLDINSIDQFQRVMGTQDTYAVLQARLQNMAQVDALNIVDAGGHLLNSSRRFPPMPIDVSDRDYFRHFAEQDDQGLFVGAPVFSRITGLP